MEENVKPTYGVGDIENYIDDGDWTDTPIFNAVSGIWNDITGKSQQYSEFQQQNALLTREQEFARDYVGQMNAMKAAGINPNTAASGIAGQGASPNAPQVSSATGGVAGAVDAAANLLGSVGTASRDLTAANTDAATREPSIENIIADTQEKLSRSGLNSEMSRNYSILNSFLSQEKQLGLVQLQQSIKNLEKQYDLYDSQIGHYNALVREIDQHIETMRSQGNLADIQALVEQKRGLLIDQQKFEIEFLNGIRSQIGLEPRMSLENNMLLLSLSNRDAFQVGLEALNDYNYYRALGQFTADEETAYQRFLGQVRAKADTEADYAEFWRQIHLNEAQFREMFKAIYAVPKDARNWMFKHFDELNLPDIVYPHGN